jgi:hypothetical protein
MCATACTAASLGAHGPDALTPCCCCCLQATHYTGKWDCGMATEAHTPKGRGYDTSLFYFHHDNE